MNARIFFPTAAALMLATLALPAQAQYLWLQSEGGQARVYSGELGKPDAKLPALTSVTVRAPGEAKAPAANTPVATAADHLSFTPAGTGDLRLTAAHAGADGVLTYYQVRHGREGTSAVNDLELVPTSANGNTYQLMFKGKPVAASQVRVDTAEGWRRTLAPAADGTVSFTPWIPGLYVLEVSAKVNNSSVTVDGKKYDDVRHTATLSFEVPRPGAK